MPLESATSIAQLVPTNPAAADGANQGDDHLRLIKSVLQAQFPNFTAAALTATQAQITSAISAVVLGTTASVHSLGSLSSPSVSFLGDLNTGLFVPGADQITIVTGGLAAVKIKADQSAEFIGNVLIDGTLTASGGIGGNVAVPIGGSLDWWTDTLPSANWAWLNGQAISRSTYSVLFGLWSTTFGTGDGSTTFNVPDLRQRATLGKSTMGGTADPLRIPTSDWTTNVLGQAIGFGQFQLATTNLPAHNHVINVTDTHTHNVTVPQTSTSYNATGSPGHNAYDASTTTVATSGTATGSITAASTNTGSGTPFTIVQPSIICNKIVRII